MFDICAFGDALIDFKPVKGINGRDCIEANAGGTAANLACTCARMGIKSAMLGKVGSDHYGTFLLQTLQEYGVCTEGMVVDPKVRTTLAFVHLDRHGDRSFSFFRNPGADLMYSENEVDFSMLEASKMFYFSSMALTDEPERTACQKAVQYARRRGKTVCFDVNLRKNLWDDLDEAKRVIQEYFPYTDILKLSEEELHFVCGQEGETEVLAEKLFSLYFPKILVVSLGERGCSYWMAGHRATLPGYPVQAVDTTGAGDVFMGGLISVLCAEHGGDLDGMTQADLLRALDFANASGAISVTRLGSITSAPDWSEVESFRNQWDG